MLVLFFFYPPTTSFLSFYGLSCTADAEILSSLILRTQSYQTFSLSSPQKVRMWPYMLCLLPGIRPLEFSIVAVYSTVFSPVLFERESDVRHVKHYLWFAPT